MRRVNYKVMDTNGVVFDTTDYERATMAGNRIVATYLTDVDLTSYAYQVVLISNRVRGDSTSELPLILLCHRFMLKNEKQRIRKDNTLKPQEEHVETKGRTR